MQDHYAVLGVSREADGREIARAYRRLARRCHPDVSVHPDAAALFRSVQEAYETLRDPAARARHDAALDRIERLAAPPVSPRQASSPAPSRPPSPSRPVEAQPTPPGRARTAALALVLALAGPALLPLSLVLGPGSAAARVLAVGFACVLALLAAVVARSLARTEQERLWRLRLLDHSAGRRRDAEAAARRKRADLAADVARLGLRAVALATPLMLLLAAR